MNTPNRPRRPMLVVYRGLPGSGKTTAALTHRKEMGGALVGRDHIRHLLFGKYTGLTYAKENTVTEIQEYLIRDAIERDDNVFVDDTNLRYRSVRRFADLADELGAVLSIVDFRDRPLSLCLKQNRSRDRQVPEEVIKRLWDVHVRQGKE